MEDEIDDAGELLELVRKADRCTLPSFATRIERVLSTRSPDKADESERPAVERGSARSRASLLAYAEILAYDRSGSVTGLAANVAEATHQLNEIFNFPVRFDVARNLLKSYTVRWPNARPLSIRVPILGDVDGPRDEFRDDQAKDLQIVSKSEATVTFVVFCGIRHSFGIQLNLLHHCCLAQRRANVVYVRDFSQSLYLTGVQSLGSVDESCGKLRELFLRLNTRKLVFLGNSGGVFGALYYGALLDADQVLVFGGPSSLDIGVEQTERQAYARVSRLRDAGKIDWPDIRALYSKNATAVSVYFGSKNAVDRQQAENLAGLPNVRLHPVKTPNHFVMDYLAELGELERAFAAASEPSPARP